VQIGSALDIDGGEPACCGRDRTVFRPRAFALAKEVPMTQQRFDGFTHRAAGAVSRRQSLLALGGAALAAGLAAPATAEAKKNPAKKAKNKVERTCNRTKERCRTVLASLGEGKALPCCERCLTSDFLICLFEIDG
jgi:hypothetical protein